MAAETALTPGSPSLGNQLDLSMHYRTLKDLQTHSDSQYQTHLVIIEEQTRNAVALAHPQLKLVKKNLLQLQALLLEAEKGHISDHLIALAQQIYFKTSADLIYLIGKKGNIRLVPLLCSLSYQSVACITFDDSQLSAWSARMALDSLTMFYSTFSSDAVSLWEDTEFANLVVDALSQDDNDGLKLLHSRIYEEAKNSADYLQPEMTVELAAQLAKRIRPLLGTDPVLQTLLLVIRRESHGFSQFAFFSSLFSTLPRAPSPCSDSELGMEDVAVFLVTLSNVSKLADSVPVIGRVKITADQLKHWKAVCHLIAFPSNCDPREKLLAKAVVNCVRLKSIGVSNLRTIYPIFQWLVDRGFPDEWIQLYAEHIREEIIGMPAVKSSSLFSVTNNFYYDQEEEQRILDVVNICLAEIAIAKGRFREADELLTEVGGKPSIKKISVLSKLYTSWIENASLEEEEKTEILLKLKKVHALMPESERPVVSPLVSPPKEPVALLPVAKEQITLSDVMSFSSPIRKSEVNEVAVETSPRALTPSSPFGDSSFVSFRSPSTRDYGTSTENSFVSAVESLGMGGDGDRTPTEVFSPTKTSPRSNEVSPPEEPFHREYVDESLDPISPSFQYDEIEEDSYLVEYIVCKMNQTTLAMEKTNKAMGYFNQAVEESQKGDMQQKMEDMKKEYEEKLRKMENELEEAKKKEKWEDRSTAAPAAAVPNLAEPRQILKNKIDEMIREQIAIQSTRYAPPTVVASAHPGHTGFCLGCASDADQDKVMRVLDSLSKKWDEED